MNLVKKFIDYATGNIISLLISLITTPIITRLYLPEEMGKYSLFLSIMGLVMTVAGLGTEQAYSRFYYEEKEENRTQLWYICCGIPVFFFLALAFISIAFWQEITEYIAGETSTVLFAFIVAYGIAYICSRFGMYLIRMQQKAKLFSLCNIVIKIFYVVIAILLAKVFKPSYLMLVISISISYFVVTILSVISERDKLRIVDKSYRLDNKISSIVRYSVPFIFSQIIFWAFGATDKIMIRQFSTYEQLGIYAGAMSLVNIIVTVQNAFMTFWTPVAYERYKNNPEDKKFFEDINAIVTVVMVIASIVVVLFKGVFSILLVRSYADSIDVLPFLIFMPIMATISETTVMGINFGKKSEWHIVVSLFSALVNITLNFYLIRLWGAKGAAIATGISYCFYYYLRTIVANRFYRCNFRMFRTSIVILFTYATAGYASFSKTNLITVVLALLTFVVLAVSYGGIIKDIVVTRLRERK